MKNELYHYGVLGMKWGVRRAQRLQHLIDRTNVERKNNKNAYNYNEQEAKSRYSNNTRKKNRALAANQVAYDASEINNKYQIARLTGKMDKAYRKTDEYREIKDAFVKQMVGEILLGNDYVEIKKLKEYKKLNNGR